MLNVEKLVGIFKSPLSKGTIFRPYHVDLNKFFPPYIEEKEPEETLTLRSDAKISIEKIDPALPKGRIVAIDTTSITLGHIKDGAVGAIRGVVVIREPEKNKIKVERYGPYLIAPTNQNKQTIYEKMRKTIFKVTKKVRSPNYMKMIDRARSFLEKILQLEAAKTYTNSLLLFDGSLISGTVDSPKQFVSEVLDSARTQKNNIAAISKRTGLSLEPTKRSILSVLEGVYGPCYAEVKPYISQKKERYLGNIYVGKFTLQGEPFRVDIPDNSPNKHNLILSWVAGLAGDYGYPEELKMAHVLCVHSSIEVLELQSAATKIYGMEIKEDIRRKIFGPFG
jgi:hypothetical protein